MSSKEPTEVSERNHLKVFLPRKLVECLPKCPVLPKEQLRWNTNEEIASYLITFEKHDEWLSCSPKTRPQNGSVILYNRKKVKYRKDGYCWKKRKDGKTTREDHMKLKVQGVECLYGCYVHSSIVPTFHRRCYWLLQNPDIVLVHYLNVPAMEECGRPCAPPLCAGAPPLCAATADPREWLKWSQEELVAQLRPMFHGIKWGCGNGGGAPAGLSLEQLVQHVLESHQTRPPPRTHACLCAEGLGTPGHKCGSTKHRIISPKVERGGGGGGGGGPPAAGEPPPKAPPSSPDTTQPSPGLGGAAPPPPPEGPPSFPPALPLLVVANLGGAAPGGPENPLGLTPSQHLVTPEGSCPTALPHGAVGLPHTAPPAAFDPDCFLNSPRRGQTYGCEAEAPPGAPPPAPPKLGGDEEEEEEEGEAGGELSARPLPFPEPLTGDAANPPPTPRGAPPTPRDPPLAPRPPPSPPAPPADPPVAITDFSPEWSYPEGGVKVLITGPWGAGAYSCLFDGVSVPAALVQPGVLRCYCPPHEAGMAALRVACPPRLLSAAAPFEYRARGGASGPPGSQLDWLSLDEAQFRLSILERLEQLETRLGALAPPPPRGGPPDTPPEQGPGSSFEARVVAICEAMMTRPGWPGTPSGTAAGTSSGTALAHGATFRGMTLLHLAAAQGYAGLVEALRRWRALAADSLELEQEVDPLNVDHFSCTPLMWACALGHREAAERLCRWDRRALAVPDTLGRLPLGLARARGHLGLVTRLEELSPASPRCHLPGLRVPSPLSASPDTGLSTASSLSSPSGLSEGPGSVPLPPAPPGPPEDEPWGGPPPTSPDADDALQAEVVTLARQIIEATPERIKQEAPGGPPGTLGTSGTSGTPGLSAAMAWLATYLESVDRPPAGPPRTEVPPQGSPGVPERPPPPPPPSAAGWAEFLNASGGARGGDGPVALLTLSDQEQHELYEAARLVQGAFRKYRGWRLKEQQEMAAAVIQRCYRKYKQFALFQRMTRAAVLIQSRFRSYAQQKRFQRRRRAALLIQQRFRSRRQRPQQPRTPSPTPRRRAPLLTLRQDQAARRIMRFLRRCHHRLEELKQNKEGDSVQKRGLAS